MKTFAQLNKKLCPFEVGPSFSQNLTFFADLLLRSAKIKQIFEIFISVLKIYIKSCLCAKFQLFTLFLSKVDQGVGGVIFTPPYLLSVHEKAHSE